MPNSSVGSAAPNNLPDESGVPISIRIVTQVLHRPASEASRRSLFLHVVAMNLSPPGTSLGQTALNKIFEIAEIRFDFAGEHPERAAYFFHGAFRFVTHLQRHLSVLLIRRLEVNDSGIRRSGNATP